MASGKKKRKGVLIAIHQSLSYQLHDSIIDPKGRYIILQCIIDNRNFTLVNLYAPNVHQMAFIRSIVDKAKSLQWGHLLLCGDFNLAPDSAIDSSASPKKHYTSLSKFLWESDLYDAWRCCHAGERDYSYLSPRHGTYSRIDLCITDKHLLDHISSIELHTAT